MSLLAGLDLPDAGEIRLKGAPAEKPGPDRGIVFQNYSLLPWLSVYGNIELAVEAGLSESLEKETPRLYPILHRPGQSNRLRMEKNLTNCPAECDNDCRWLEPYACNPKSFYWTNRLVPWTH